MAKSKAKVKSTEERVREHLVASKLSAREFAKRAGWPADTNGYMRAYRLINGLVSISADDIDTIARVLEKPVSAICEAA